MLYALDSNLPLSISKDLPSVHIWRRWKCSSRIEERRVVMLSGKTGMWTTVYVFACMCDCVNVCVCVCWTEKESNFFKERENGEGTTAHSLFFTLELGCLFSLMALLTTCLLHNCLTTVTGQLKKGLFAETKAWKVAYGKAANKKFGSLMSEVLEFVEDIQKRLQRPIKDLDDIRFIISALKELRAQEIRIDMAIGPIEVCWSFCP